MLVWRRPVLALYAFVVGLILNNTVFLLLFAAGARGWQLTTAQAWKETLLAIALARVARDAVARRALSFRLAWVDLAAAAFAVVIFAYALLPQHLLGGDAGAKAELYEWPAREFRFQQPRWRPPPLGVLLSEPAPALDQRVKVSP